MSANRDTHAELLRIVYRRRMQIQFNLKSILSQYIARDNRANVPEGELVSHAVHMAVTGGVRYTDDDTAAEAGSQSAGEQELGIEAQVSGRQHLHLLLLAQARRTTMPTPRRAARRRSGRGPARSPRSLPAATDSPG